MAIRRRARTLRVFWWTERRTFRQGSLALLLSTVAGLIAGLTLGSITHVLEALPGLFILIPAAVGMKGTIFGAIGARLGTSIHAGTFEVSRARDGPLAQNVRLGVLLTFSSALYLAILAKGTALVAGLHAISLVDFVTISVAVGCWGRPSSSSSPSSCPSCPNDAAGTSTRWPHP